VNISHPTFSLWNFIVNTTAITTMTLVTLVRTTKNPNPGQERGHHHIIKITLFGNEHLIDARLSSTRSLFAADGPPGEIGLDSTGGHQESSDMSRNIAKTFSGLIKLMICTLTETTD